MSTAVVTDPEILDPAPVDQPSKGITTYLGFGLAFLLAAPAWIGALADSTEPLGLDPHIWIYASAGVAAGTALLRYVQAFIAKIAARDPSSPSLGLATILSLVVVFLEGLPVLFTELSDSLNPLNVDPSVWVKAAVINSAALGIGRVLQSAVGLWFSLRGPATGPILEEPPTTGTGTEEPPPITDPAPPPGG